MDPSLIALAALLAELVIILCGVIIHALDDHRDDKRPEIPLFDERRFLAEAHRELDLVDVTVPLPDEVLIPNATERSDRCTPAETKMVTV